MCRSDRLTVKVAAGLIECEGRLLITRRKANVHLGGYWEFPGGKCEDGESLEMCLLRELREELGIRVVDLVCLGAYAHDDPERSVELTFFACRIAEGEPQPLGSDEIRWVARSELRQLTFPPADQRMIARLLA